MKGRGSFVFFLFFPCSSVGGEGGKRREEASKISPLGWLHPGRERKKGFALFFLIITLLLSVLQQHRCSFQKKNIFPREKKLEITTESLPTQQCHGQLEKRHKYGKFNSGNRIV